MARAGLLFSWLCGLLSGCGAATDVAAGEPMTEAAHLVGDYRDGSAPMRIQTREGTWYGYVDRTGSVVLDHEHRVCRSDERDCDGIPAQPVSLDALQLPDEEPEEE